MNHIDELITEHCPDGVSFQMLGDVTTKAAGIKWSTLDAGEERCYIDLSSVDRVTKKIGETLAVNSSNAPSRARQIVKTNDVIFATTRPAQMRWALITPEYDDQVASTGYCVLRPRTELILPAFLAHVLGSKSFQRYVEANQIEGNYPSIPDSRVRAFKAPIPPLEVQRAIIEILDTFSKLEAELEAELEARKQQYEHYRAELLTSAESAEWSTLGAVSSKVSSGGTPSSGNASYYGGDIPWLRTQEVNFDVITSTGVSITEAGFKNSSAKWIPENCVIVAMYGATAAKVAINAIPLTTNQACCNLQIDDSIAEYRYVFHWISNQYEKLKSLGEGSQSNLNAKKVKDFPIPVPPLEEQRRIVGILDKCDALVNDLSVGLPAELAARRQQYEYYRDKLLTFNEQEAAA